MNQNRNFRNHYPVFNQASVTKKKKKTKRSSEERTDQADRIASCCCCSVIKSHPTFCDPMDCSTPVESFISFHIQLLLVMFTSFNHRLNGHKIIRAEGLEIMGKCPNPHNSETTKEENKIYFSLYLFSIYSSTTIPTS